MTDLRTFVSDPRFQSKDDATKRAMLIDYGVEDGDIAPLISFRIQPSSADAPDVRGIGSGPAVRAGVQVLAPINGKAVVDSVLDAGQVMQAMPGAMASVYGDYASGAMKGLGGMADEAIKRLGLPRSQYADAAFEPSNDVQAVGKGGAQAGTTILGTEAALGALGLSTMGTFIAKILTNPATIGGGQTAYEIAQGEDVIPAVKHGATTAATVGALKVAPGVIGKAVSKMFPKASAAEIATATTEAETALAKKPLFSDKTPLEQRKAMLDAADAYKAQHRIRPIPPSKLTPDVQAASSEMRSKAAAEYRAKVAAEDAKRKSAQVIRPDDAPSVVEQSLSEKAASDYTKTQSAAVLKQIDEAVSPGAALDQLKTHGIGGKKIPDAEARAMVDAVWMDKDTSYKSVEQWMADNAKKRNARRTRS